MYPLPLILSSNSCLFCSFFSPTLFSFYISVWEVKLAYFQTRWFFFLGHVQPTGGLVGGSLHSSYCVFCLYPVLLILAESFHLSAYVTHLHVVQLSHRTVNMLTTIILNSPPDNSSILVTPESGSDRCFVTSKCVFLAFWHSLCFFVESNRNWGKEAFSARIYVNMAKTGLYVMSVVAIGTNQASATWRIPIFVSVLDFALPSSLKREFSQRFQL